MISFLSNGEAIYLSAGRRGLELDPDLTIAQWADEYRMLSSEGGAEPGKYRVERTPYLREIMDCLSPSHECLRVVLMKASQIGATEAINNWIGFVIHLAPGPFLMVQPTQDLAKKVSKQRIATAILETEVLSERIAQPRERDSGNTLLTKEFAGGVLMLTGANSAAGLRSMPVRYLALDEVDAYPADLDDEGDPVKIAEKRTATFSRRKIFITSTPTLKNFSRIEKEFDRSDQRFFYVPCPECGEYQVLKWENLHYEQKDYKLISEVTHICTKCGVLIEERHKTEMLSRGKWVAHNKDGDFPGFHLSALYSPLGWTSWRSIVEEYLEFTRTKDINLQKTWKNTVLGETFEPVGKEIDYTGLFNRREDFPKDYIQKEIALITAGVDTQDDRIEITVVGWARDEESYILDYVTLFGDLSKPVIWANLDQFLLKTYKHESGLMRISCVAIDTGGHYTSEVYEFAKSRETRKIYAVKGSSMAGIPISGKPSRQKSGVYLFSIGVDTAKDLLFNRLTINEKGAGYIHFPIELTENYFNQLTAEKAVTKYSKGFAKREWIKIRDRNEALDMFVYAIAALNIFAFMVYPNLTINQMLETISKLIENMSRLPEIRTETQPAKRSRMLNSGLNINDL